MPYCDCGNFSRDVLKGGDCSSCERRKRKGADEAVKSEEKRNKAGFRKRTGIKKGGNSNTYLCSDGSRVTQGEIDRRRSVAYKAKYPVQEATCHGCWKRKAHGSAHIIPQARLKQLGMTELIWNPIMFFPGCIQCNLAIENPKGQNWKKLLNIDECLEIISRYDPELYTKFMNNKNG